MIRFHRVATLATAAALLFTTAAHAGPRIVNGLSTQDFPTTGALLYSGGGVIEANNASSWCSGTLIGCQTFLTAAHCVNDDVNASHYWVYLQNGGLAPVSSITYHPSYNPAFSGRDVAIVKLASPVTGIAPTAINTTHNLQAMGLGLDGLIAGFGRTGGGSDYGVKRYGAVTTANCNTAQTSGEGNDVLVCWDYTSPVGAPGTDSNTCNGDSGGPLFMDFAGVREIVGVTSAGVDINCQPTDHSWDASVYYNASWILGQLGADSTSTCGGFAPVGAPSTEVTPHNGSLSSGTPTASHTVNLSGAPTLVRFTLNGTDNGSFNPNFFVKEGLGASATLFDCKGDGASVFGACEFTNPSAGPWSIFVQQAAGAGEYQVTTTVYGGDAPVCGNDVAEFAEQCDGVDLGVCPVGPCTACACPAPVCGNDIVEAGEQCDGADLGVCALGPCNACVCPAPQCGNGVVEAGEECDGAADTACPGQCIGDCSCEQTCARGDLYGLKIRANARSFSYKSLLYDEAGAYSDLDPRDTPFELSITDAPGLIELSIPAGDAGWVKADPLRHQYQWKGDGSLDGLRRVKLTYKSKALPYWQININGRAVTGADTIDVANVLDFHLEWDGTCHLETW